MALTLGDNFSYQGAKPLDARLKYDTLAAMKAVADATMYDGCMAYCSATDKTYQWKSSNTVDPDTGKWREFSSGGGGGSTYTAGEGIVIENDEISIDPMPAEDMDDVIDELPTGGNIAVTGYVPLGTLIPYYGETAPKFFLACDGSTYNKADYPELAKHLLSLTNNTPYIVDGDATKFKVPDLRGEFIRGTGTNSRASQGSGADVGGHQDSTEIPTVGFDQNGKLFANTNKIYFTGENKDNLIMGRQGYSSATYTAGAAENVDYKYMIRPTNTSVLFCIAYKDIYSNPMNDYSTDEKVVGTWIDGKTLYQRTIVKDLSKITGTERKFITLVSSSELPSNIENMPFIKGTLGGKTLPLINYVSAGAIGVSFCGDLMYASTNNEIQALHYGTTWLNDGTGSLPLILTIQYTKV